MGELDDEVTEYISCLYQAVRSVTAFQGAGHTSKPRRLGPRSPPWFRVVSPDHGAAVPSTKPCAVVRRTRGSGDCHC